VIQPLDRKALKPLLLLERGAAKGNRASCSVANLPQGIADREVAVAKSILKGWGSDCIKSDRLKDVTGPGNVVICQSSYENITETCTGFGGKGISAEQVATGCCEEMKAYLEDPEAAPVWEHCADQLLLPLVLAAGGAYRATARALTGSLHFTTNVEIIGMFLGKDLIKYETTDTMAAAGAGAAGASAGAGAAVVAGAASSPSSILVTIKPWSPAA
jgi:RNA 3'-terminal phosphate cyclase (ATP)